MFSRIDLSGPHPQNLLFNQTRRFELKKYNLDDSDCFELLNGENLLSKKIKKTYFIDG